MTTPGKIQPEPHQDLTKLTARARAEVAMGEQAQDFRALAEAVPQIVWATRPDGWNIYFNQQWVDYTGLTMEESYGHGWNTPFHPDDKQRAWEAWQRATQQNERYSLECRLRRHDGVYRWWLIRGVPVRSPKGEIQKWFGTCTDIEEIKKAQAALQEANNLLEQRVAERTAALRESQAKLKAAFASMTEAIFLADAEGRLIDFNEGFVRYHRFKDREECSRTIADCPRYLEAYFQDGTPAPPERWAMARALGGETASEVEYMLRRKETGETWWGSYNFAPIKDEGGRIVGAVVAVREITERKRAEEQMRELTQRLTYHVDHSPLAVIEWGPDMRLTRWSSEAERLFGWKAEEVLGKRMEDFRWIYHEDELQVAEFSGDLQTGANPRRFSAHRNYRKDGSVVHCEWYNSSLADASGKLLSILSLVLDVTERKRAQEAARDSERRFQMLADATFEGIAIAEGGRFIDANGQLLKMLGFSREELMGTEVLARMVPEDQDRVAGIIREGSESHIEQQIIRKDGSRIIVEAHGRTVHHVNRKLRITAIRDITERKRAEEQLRRAKELGDAVNRISTVLHSTLDAEEIVRRIVTEGVAALGSETAAISAREGGGWSVRHVQGMPPEMVGMRLEDEQERHAVLAIKTRDVVAVADAFNDERFNREYLRRHNVRSVLVAPLMSRDEPFGVLFLNYHAAPHVFTEAELSFARQLAAAAASALENARLFEEQKRAQEALRQSEERFRTLFETMSEGFSLDEIICDESGNPCDLRYLELNPAFERHTGLKRADIVGRTTLELWPNAEPIWFEVYGKVALTGEPAHFQAQFGPLNRWFEVSAYQTQPGRFATVFFDITESKRAEEAVRKNNETFHRLIENNPMGIYVVDADFRMRNASLGAQRAFVNVPAPLLGRDLGECLRTMWPEPCASEAIERFRHTLETGEAYVARDTIEQRRDTGAVEAYDWRIERITLPDGRHGVVCYYYDLTEQRRLEQQLRESEERLRFSLESCQIGAWNIDLEDQTAYRSLEHDRIFGHQELLPSWTLDDFLKHALPEYREPVEKMVREATAAKTGWTYECQIRRADGEIRWIWFSGQHRTDSAGHSRVAGVVQDITARKQAEEALRESELRYRAIGESIDFGVWVCAPDGRNIYASPSFLKLVGLTQEQCSSFGWGDVLHPDDAARTIAAWQECIRTGGLWDIEHRFRGVDGKYHPVLARGVPVRNDQGEIVCWAGINLDIRRVKEAEEELRRRAEELCASNKELESFNRTMVGRELRMVELKQEIDDLCIQFGLPPRYGPQLNEKEHQ